MNRIYIFLVLIIFCSCSKNYYFDRDQITIYNALSDMKDTDQGVRGHASLVNNQFKLRTMYTVYDSLSVAGVKEEDVFKYDISKIPSIEKQVEKMSQLQKEEYTLINKRGEKLFTLVDSVNQVCIYDMTKKYGYPSYYKRNWTKTPKIGIAFVMSHIVYKTKMGKKMLKLMIPEFLKGRVDEGEMKQYLWSIDGRKGYPYNYVIDIEYWKKKAQND